MSPQCGCWVPTTGTNGHRWRFLSHSLERLASDYGLRDDVQALLNKYEIWIVPVVNPDGTAEYSRRNANSVDLNRNYGFTWTPGLGKGTYLSQAQEQPPCG